MTTPRRANRGRGAAQENRRALVEAALEVFAEQGIGAPLSAVAKRAGVGQGSLYRHFPDRVSLALAAFEANVAELEALAGQPSRTLDELLGAITRHIITSVTFVDIVTAGGADPRVEAIGSRVATLFVAPLGEARQQGRVRDDVSVDDLMLAVSMVAAVVAKFASADREATAQRAWVLLDRALRP